MITLQGCIKEFQEVPRGSEAFQIDYEDFNGVSINGTMEVSGAFRSISGALQKMCRVVSGDFHEPFKSATWGFRGISDGLRGFRVCFNRIMEVSGAFQYTEFQSFTGAIKNRNLKGLSKVPKSLPNKVKVAHAI